MDLVDAHVLGLKWLEDGKGSRVFNLGTGKGFSVREVLDHGRAVTNREVPVIPGQRRAGDCDTAGLGLRSRDRRNWDGSPGARRSSVMIRDAWRWHQNGGYA